MKALVVYFSLTGNTRKIGGIIAKALKADSEEIVPAETIDAKKDPGNMAFVSLFGRIPEIKEAKKDPAKYDLLVLGGQPWAFNLSPPVKSYIIRNRGHFPKKMAFFITHGGIRGNSTIEQMAGLSRRTPVATLLVREREIEYGGYEARLKGFISELKRVV